tara:strand:- start:2161 stop:3672 length:1512 start_codon:yes stop_codon:yes gene_type:complete
VAQDTLSVQNGTGVAVRQAFNTAMQASATNQSGSSAPSTTYPFQFYADTNTNTLKLRNAANNAYINVSGVGQIGAANLGLLPASGGTISGNLIVSGNFTVQGTTTTVSSTTITVTDKNIEIGKVSTPTDTTADGGGLTLLGATNKTWNWVDSTDSWTSSEHIDLASGKVLKAAGTQILSATNFTGTSAIATNVTVADESTDTSCNVLFTTAATGNLPPKTGTNLTFNSSSGALTATSFNGDLVGNIPDNSVTSAKIVDGAIVNADVNASAAIARTKLANVDLVDDTSPQLGGDLDVNTKNIVFGDSASASDDRLILGAGSDLQIYHDGSHSYIEDAGTGQLRLKTGQLTVLSTADETMIKAQQNNQVELYYDNAKKLETTSTGISVTGGGTFTGAVIHNYTSALQVPVGTTAQRPASPSTGDFRFNSTTTEAEIYDGSSFTSVGGGGGGATGGGGEKIFHESENEMNSSYTISSNHNALVAGPLTIASGATLTVNSPSVVTIP